MDPLASAIDLLNVEINKYDPDSKNNEITRGQRECYEDDLYIISKIKELLMYNNITDISDCIRKLADDELSIICPRDADEIHRAIGLSKDVLTVVDKWLS